MQIHLFLETQTLKQRSQQSKNILSKTSMIFFIYSVFANPLLNPATILDLRDCE